MVVLHPHDIPPELDKYGRIGQLIKMLWNEVRKTSSGDPGKHAATHRVSGSDPLQRPLNPPPFVKVSGTQASSDVGLGPSFMREDAQLRVQTGVPAGMANAAAEGTADDQVARRGHQHKRDVRVKKASVDVGTRNAIDLGDGLVATDDPINDTVKIAAAAVGSSSTATLQDYQAFRAVQNLAVADIIARNYR